MKSKAITYIFLCTLSIDLFSADTARPDTVQREDTGTTDATTVLTVRGSATGTGVQGGITRREGTGTGVQEEITTRTETDTGRGTETGKRIVMNCVLVFGHHNFSNNRERRDDRDRDPRSSESRVKEEPRRDEREQERR